MTDNEIRTAVEKELDWEPAVNSAGVHVAVVEGVVTLTGHVESYPQRHEAVRASGRVRGVKAVVDHLEVRIGEPNQRADEELAIAASNIISWNTEIPLGSIRITIENGRVKLDGIVDYDFQRRSAHRSLRYLTGVKDVNNHVMVKPHPVRKLVKADIKAALGRNAVLDASGISVDTNGDGVILGGSVDSWSERMQAERAAWASPGVCYVENKIIVAPGRALLQSA